jgi:hypothetical protein
MQRQQQRQMQMQQQQQQLQMQRLRQRQKQIPFGDDKQEKQDRYKNCGYGNWQLPIRDCVFH